MIGLWLIYMYKTVLCLLYKSTCSLDFMNYILSLSLSLMQLYIRSSVIVWSDVGSCFLSVRACLCHYCLPTSIFLYLLWTLLNTTVDYQLWTGFVLSLWYVCVIILLLHVPVAPLRLHVLGTAGCIYFMCILVIFLKASWRSTQPTIHMKVFWSQSLSSVLKTTSSEHFCYKSVNQSVIFVYFAGLTV